MSITTNWYEGKRCGEKRLKACLLTFQTNKTSFILAVQQKHSDVKKLHNI